MRPANEVPLTVVVLTYNEERNLPACLESVAGWASEVFVVDSGSTDGTVAVAERYGAKIVAHEFETHARQWNWALRSLPFAQAWVLCLDADHRVTAELAVEIATLLGREGEVEPKASRLGEMDGFYIKRRQVFRGQWISHGGYYPKYMLKLVRHERAWCDENELLDFRLYVKGPTGRLRHDVIEANEKEADISFWIAKHNRFASLVAEEEMRRASGGAAWAIEPALFGSPDQRVLWLKERWYRLPLYVRPCLYFFYRYVIRCGFLDGKEGFIFHFLQGFWYRLLVDIKLDERRQQELGRRGPTRPGGHGQ
jgi:glycosyltransferase involved in cell wall biosynthesis